MTTVKAKGKTYKKGDVYKVPPTDINIIEGFNASNRCDDVSDIIDSIKENGVIEPLQGYREKGSFYVTSGHRRLTAVLKLLEQGVEIQYIPFIAKPKLKEDLQIFDVILNNSGKPLTELQEAEIFQRLINYGYKQEEIAKKIGKTQAMVSQRIKLFNSITKYLKNCLVNELMSAHAAMRLNTIHEDEKDQKIIVDKILIKKAKIKGKKPSVDKAIKELKEAGRYKISSTEIPNKPGRQKTADVKRTTKYQKMFDNGIEYLKEQGTHQSKITKIETIAKALYAKTHQTLMKTILSVL